MKVGDRIIASVKAEITEKRSIMQAAEEGRKRFTVRLDLPGELLFDVDIEREEIQCYDVEQSQELRDLAYKVIDRMPEVQHIDEFIGRENIGFLLSYEPKQKDGQQVPGECIAVKKIYRALTNFRYLIVFYEPNLDGLDDKQKAIIMLHELLHIHADGTLTPHDVNDFAALLRAYGIGWNEPGAVVIDILAGDEDEKAGRKNRKGRSAKK